MSSKVAEVVSRPHVRSMCQARCPLPSFAVGSRDGAMPSISPGAVEIRSGWPMYAAISKARTSQKVVVESFTQSDETVHASVAAVALRHSAGEAAPDAIWQIEDMHVHYDRWRIQAREGRVEQWVGGIASPVESRFSSRNVTPHTGHG